MDDTAAHTTRFDKPAWRRWARTRRDALDGRAWSGALLAAVRAWPAYRQAGTVLTYRALPAEPDLNALAEDAKRWVVPRVDPATGRLTLHRLDPGTLRRGAWGVEEPPPEAEPVPAEIIDLALIPGLAFDRAGTRLGHGQGHFDRLLPALRPASPRVGVTHTTLLAPRLPREAHDVPMTHLLTEGGVLPSDA